jgi:hypothetical protein
MRLDTPKVPSAHFNGLTPAEAERLAILSEELGEAQQCIGKILRHGYESTWDNGVSNREYLERELGDVDAIMTLMFRNKDINIHEIDKASLHKLERVKGYTHHQEWDYKGG